MNFTEVTVFFASFRRNEEQLTRSFLDQGALPSPELNRHCGARFPVGASHLLVACRSLRRACVAAATRSFAFAPSGAGGAKDVSAATVQYSSAGRANAHACVASGRPVLQSTFFFLPAEGGRPGRDMQCSMPYAMCDGSD